MIRILADADALPVAVKEILYRASGRVGARLVLVANQPLGHPKSPLISCEVVASGPDEADHRGRWRRAGSRSIRAGRSTHGRTSNRLSRCAT